MQLAQKITMHPNGHENIFKYCLQFLYFSLSNPPYHQKSTSKFVYLFNIYVVFLMTPAEFNKVHEYFIFACTRQSIDRSSVPRQVIIEEGIYIFLSGNQRDRLRVVIHIPFFWQWTRYVLNKKRPQELSLYLFILDLCASFNIRNGTWNSIRIYFSCFSCSETSSLSQY